LGAIKPLDNATSAYLHPQSDSGKSINFPVQVFQTCTRDIFIITLSISLLVIVAPKLYASGVPDWSTMIQREDNEFAASVSVETPACTVKKIENKRVVKLSVLAIFLIILFIIIIKKYKAIFHCGL